MKELQRVKNNLELIYRHTEAFYRAADRQGSNTAGAAMCEAISARALVSISIITELMDRLDSGELKTEVTNVL